MHVDHIFSIDEGACRLTGECCDEDSLGYLTYQFDQFNVSDEENNEEDVGFGGY